MRRALVEASFGLHAALRRWGHPDAIILVSPALISSILIAVRARLTHRHTPLVVWVQDLYALGLTETGQAGGRAVQLMAVLEGWLLCHADRVVVIHERIAARVVRDFGVPRDRIEVIRNWTHLPRHAEVDVPATRARLGWGLGETIALHAGNMGVKQGLENLVEAARLAAQRQVPVRIVLLGNGTERDRLRALGEGLDSLELRAPLDDKDYLATLASADVLVVNEKPGVSEMSVPSKLTSYFSSGRPVVAATGAGGVTAGELRAAGAGVEVAAGDPEALLDQVIALAAEPERMQRLGANGRRYRETVLDEETALDRFSEMLDLLVAERPDAAPPANRSTERSSS